MDQRGLNPTASSWTPSGYQQPQQQAYYPYQQPQMQWDARVGAWVPAQAGYFPGYQQPQGAVPPVPPVPETAPVEGPKAEEPEVVAEFAEEEEDPDNEVCPYCNRRVGDHTMQELDLCISKEAEEHPEEAHEPEKSHTESSNAKVQMLGAAVLNLCVAPKKPKATVVEEEEDKEAPEEATVESSRASPVPGDVDFSEMDFGDPRPHLNVVFIGHVDAGKSTLSGNILYLTGHVDARTIEKYQKDAKSQNRESWFLAFIMDTNEEERAKGKTVEVGRAHFDTKDRRLTILDAPGHKNYVPNMIGGAAQADVGVLVISARKGEFETGFERGGQTREHAMLAKTLGVRHLVVVVNKMDDMTVKWSESRYNTCIKKLKPFLKQCGYTKKQVNFLPISAMSGQNIVNSEDLPAWVKGPCLLDVLNSIKTDRDPDSPLRVPVIDRYTDRGTVVMGKVEAGVLYVGQKLVVMPTGSKAEVVAIDIAGTGVDAAKPGENVRVKLKGVKEEHLQKGFVLCDAKRPLVQVATKLEAQMKILELPEHRCIFSAGYNAIIHCHTLEEECVATKILSVIDPRTGKPMKSSPPFVKSNSLVTASLSLSQTICVEDYATMAQLGRFTLRDEGRTIAIGKIVKVFPPE